MQERKAPREQREPDPASEAWNQLPWRKLEKHCFHIQKRIYRASQRGNIRAVHPYDGNLLYWSQRLKTHPMMHETKARLLQKQQGKCRWCELHFKDGDILEVDHIDRDHDHDHLSNKMLIHRHCHDERHAKHIEMEKRLKLAAAGINIQ